MGTGASPWSGLEDAEGRSQAASEKESALDGGETTEDDEDDKDEDEDTEEDERGGHREAIAGANAGAGWKRSSCCRGCCGTDHTSLAQRIGLRVGIFFAVIVTLASLTYFINVANIQRAKYFSADINNAGKRRYLSREVRGRACTRATRATLTVASPPQTLLLVMETMRNDCQLYCPPTSLANQLQAALGEFERVHVGLSVRSQRRRARVTPTLTPPPRPAP